MLKTCRMGAEMAEFGMGKKKGLGQFTQEEE